jgi:hypothetical protein
MTMPAKKTDAGYELTYEGVDYAIVKKGNLWEIFADGKYLSSVKQVKQAKAYISQLSQEVTEKCTAMSKGPGLWDMVSPAIHMVLMLDELQRGPTDSERNTLHCLGYLDDDGNPDVTEAKRAISRF